MRIQVIGDDSINEQARTYAEYRLFAALAQVIDTSRIQSASLQLRRVPTRRPGHGVICTIVIELEDGDVVRFEASAGHPYAAINRGVDRLRLRVRPKSGIRDQGSGIRDLGSGIRDLGSEQMADPLPRLCCHSNKVTAASNCHDA